MNLKQWREKLGITMADAEAKLGVSQPTISRIERGIQYPGPQTIAKLFDKSGGTINANDLHKAWEAYRQASAA